MKWTVHGRRAVYDSPWISLDLVDVERPDGARYEQHVVRMGRPVAGAAVEDGEGRVLLIWRHRFITDTWGWEIPTGRVDDGETPAEAAAREVEEETGWRPGPMRPLVDSQPSNGSINAVHHLFRADGATLIGEPTDPTEADCVEWVPLASIRKLIAEGQIVSGPTLIALLFVLADHDQDAASYPALTGTFRPSSIGLALPTVVPYRTGEGPVTGMILGAAMPCVNERVLPAGPVVVYDQRGGESIDTAAERAGYVRVWARAHNCAVQGGAFLDDLLGGEADPAALPAFERAAAFLAGNPDALILVADAARLHPDPVVRRALATRVGGRVFAVDGDSIPHDHPPSSPAVRVGALLQAGADGRVL